MHFYQSLRAVQFTWYLKFTLVFAVCGLAVNGQHINFSSVNFRLIGHDPLHVDWPTDALIASFKAAARWRIQLRFGHNTHTRQLVIQFVCSAFCICVLLIKNVQTFSQQFRF